ncbi:MAG: hypothetical protein NC931_00855 [Candidatus Omnitrophica bacterium]|nr:hypothetical protein [Candidatus Omnitrophota bacterium]
MRIPSYIYLYDGGKSKSLKLESILEYLKNIFRKSKIQIREEFITYYIKNSNSSEKEITHLAREMAEIKVRKIENRNAEFEPLPGEIEYEKRRLSESSNKSFGILYDGFELITTLSKLISKEESGLNHCHIIFTNQLFATWDEDDKRYHARVSVYGFPSIISTTGLVEALAKPRGFYLKKQMGIDVNVLKQEFVTRIIEYDDPRMTELMKRYVMQAIFYHTTGNLFCEDKICCLYNAHWQEDVIQTQLQLCHKHKEIVDQISQFKQGG